MVAGLVELVVRLDFPADAVDVGNLARSHRNGQVREVEAVATVWCNHTDQAAANFLPAMAERHLGVDDLPAQNEHVVVDERIEVSASKEGARNLPAQDALHLGLP